MIKWMTSRGVSIGGIGSADHLQSFSVQRLPSQSPIQALPLLQVRWRRNSVFCCTSKLGCFCPISPALFVFSLISQWKQMIYVQSSLEFMCYYDKVCGPACVSTYFMSVYWDRRLPTGGHKTLFRGNAKSHQFPIHSLSPAFPYEWWILSS